MAIVIGLFRACGLRVVDHIDESDGPFSMAIRCLGARRIFQIDVS